MDVAGFAVRWVHRLLVAAVEQRFRQPGNLQRRRTVNAASDV